METNDGLLNNSRGNEQASRVSGGIQSLSDPPTRPAPGSSIYYVVGHPPPPILVTVACLWHFSPTLVVIENCPVCRLDEWIGPSSSAHINDLSGRRM